jgi:hypothetical protein
MELSIPVHAVNTQNIYFTEKKKNIIVDGDFTKILYSTDVFEMNGLYIFTPFHILNVAMLPAANQLKNANIMDLSSNIHASSSRIYEEETIVKDRTPNQNQNWTQINRVIRRTFSIDFRSTYNLELIEILCKIERNIIDRYIVSHCPSKTASYILKTQLLSGTIKYHSEYKDMNRGVDSSDDTTHLSLTCKTILKISGIWETASSVGITMKFIISA